MAGQQWTMQRQQRKQSLCRWTLQDHLMSKHNMILFWDRLTFYFRTCCVCRSHLVIGSVVVPSEDRDVVFFARNIWIPEGARCCSHHIIDRRLSRGAADLIKPLSIRYQEWNSSQIETLFSHSLQWEKALQLRRSMGLIWWLMFGFNQSLDGWT